MANAFVEHCKAVYADLKAAQDARLEAWAVGYAGDESLFWENEDRVLYKDVLVAVAAEWRARKDAELAELEYWLAREAEFFAVELEPAEVELEAADAAVFRTRSGALAAALLAGRRIVRAGLVIARRAVVEVQAARGAVAVVVVVADRLAALERGPAWARVGTFWAQLPVKHCERQLQRVNVSAGQAASLDSLPAVMRGHETGSIPGSSTKVPHLFTQVGDFFCVSGG
ncbi:hypothetical protein SEA_SCHMIDT_31 [Gordonia phage Schmidt]|uniref:Uncharacterized protein n=1 Tax=Gordonia phage Schmidt TaxID=2301697 RepID=A0A385E058_9CAUD|nr:hypothetical protein KDJ59_gp31 [Gordonia phage Schmidt]AXQ65153.1 hypothetical protein SEA_SCHMIDT_31 [Gordonia phage Schmidt]